LTPNLRGRRPRVGYHDRHAMGRRRFTGPGLLEYRRSRPSTVTTARGKGLPRRTWRGYAYRRQTRCRAPHLADPQPADPHKPRCQTGAKSGSSGQLGGRLSLRPGAARSTAFGHRPFSPALQGYTGTQNGFQASSAPSRSISMVARPRPPSSLRSVPLAPQVGGRPSTIGWREKLVGRSSGWAWSHEYADTARPVCRAAPGRLAPTIPLHDLRRQPAARRRPWWALSANTVVRRGDQPLSPATRATSRARIRTTALTGRRAHNLVGRHRPGRRRCAGRLIVRHFFLT